MKYQQYDMNDLIAAPATPAGGSIAIIRISGTHALSILLPLFRRLNLSLCSLEHFPSRYLQRVLLWDFKVAMVLDDVMVVFFQAPNSFTGEDVVEIHCHGSQVILSRIMELLSFLGVRAAKPGEFSRRAFLHNKMDLAAAEAIVQLVNADSLRAARQAVLQSLGSLSQPFMAIRQQIVHHLSWIEAYIDFADEELEPLNYLQLAQEMDFLLGECDQLLKFSFIGQKLRDGLALAIIGRPNVGKSTLFNRLLGQNRAIVSPIPGTTRDVLQERIVIDGIPVRLIDMAGLREVLCPVEKEGIERAHTVLANADVQWLVLDAASGLTEEDKKIYALLDPERLMIVWNKADLMVNLDGVSAIFANHPTFFISAKSGEGLDALLAFLGQKYLVPKSFEESGNILLVARQVAIVQQMVQALVESKRLLQQNEPSLELVALGLHRALSLIAELTGEVTTDDILDQIFAQFCIGK